ncbi:hypothetical protein Trydic_g1645 [Trypoxylus dichotomus]
MFRILFVIFLICIATFLTTATSVHNFYWRNYSHGEIPYDALEVSPGIYVGQVHVKEGNMPAAIYPFRRSAIVVHRTRLEIKEHIKILCTPEPEKFYWEPVDFTKVNMIAMKDAVLGGFESSYLLYIGLVHHLDSWKIGIVYDVEITGWEGVYLWSNSGARRSYGMGLMDKAITSEDATPTGIFTKCMATN